METDAETHYQTRENMDCIFITATCGSRTVGFVCGGASTKNGEQVFVLVDISLRKPFELHTIFTSTDVNLYVK